MPVLKSNQYDRFKLEEKMNDDPSMRFRNSEIEDCLDITSAFYKRKCRKVDEPDNPCMEKFLDGLMQTEEYETTRQSTVRKFQSSYYAMKKILPQYLAEKNNWKDKDADELRRDIKRQMKKVAEETEDFTAIADFCDLDAPDDFGKNEPQEMVDKVKCVEKMMNHKLLKKLIDMIGRSVATAESVLESTFERGENKLTGVTMGDDLTKVLSHELAMVGVCPELFAIKLHDKSLMELQYEGKQKQKDGAKIFMLDESGSMDGLKILVAKGMLFGGYLAAKARNKDFYVIRFSGGIECHEIKNNFQLMQLMDKFMNGSTNFNKPLSKMVEIIGSNPKYKLADGVIITDGQSDVSTEVRKMLTETKARLRFRLVGACINDRSDFAHKSGYVRHLETFCDKVFDVYADGLISQEKFMEDVYA